MTASPGMADDIEDLLHQGHPVETVVRMVGENDPPGTREDVMAVLRDRDIDLDASGRIPRMKRSTAPRALRKLAAPVAAAPSELADRAAAPETVEITKPTRTQRSARGPKRPPKPSPPVPDPLTGAPLPTEPPSPAEALAEQAELDVPIRSLADAERDVAALRLEDAREIRAQVDKMAPRVLADGWSINPQFVAIESSLRTRHGIPSYVPELDGPGKYRPTRQSCPAADGAPCSLPAEAPGCCLSAPPPFVQGPLALDTALTAPEPAAATTRHDGVDLDEWLDVASRSTSPAVRALAEEAAELAEQLHDVLDDMVRAEQDAAHPTEPEPAA